MPIVLAFEPDLRQASALERIVRDRVGADFTLVESKDQAIAAVKARIPDLILLTAFVSPSDENDIADLIRDTDGAEHTQTLTIPMLDVGTKPSKAKRKRGLLSALTGGGDTPSGPAGCDPGVFAEEIANYLQQAEQARVDAAALRERRGKKATRKKKDVEAQAAPAPAAPASYWSWDTVAPAAAEPDLGRNPEPVLEKTSVFEPVEQAASDGGVIVSATSVDAAPPEPTTGGSTWANPWDVSAPSIVKPAPSAETYLDDIIMPAPELGDSVRAELPDSEAVRAGLQPSLTLPPTAEAVAEAGDTRPPAPLVSEVGTPLAEVTTPATAQEPTERSHPEAVRAGLQPRPPETPHSNEPEDDVPARRRVRRPDDFEPDYVPAKLPTRAESGALLALQADLARLRQQRESTGTVLGTAKAAQERAAKAAADAAERVRREADLRAEQAAARAREEAQAERRARELAERRAQEEADRRAAAERKAQENAERLAREAAEKAREEAARQARLEHERRLDEERKARADAERRAAAEREARELAERRAKEEAARLEREARERQAHAEAERKAREAAEAHAAAERKAREEAERRAKQEAERIAREVERKAKVEAERLARQAEARAREEAERIARDAERRAREEAERVAREAERKAAEQAQRAAREAERKVREEAERLARTKAEELAREKEARARDEARAERLAREEAEKRADAERHARLELERRTEADRKAREQAERDAREEAERAAEAARRAPARKIPKKRKAPAAAKPARKKDSRPSVQDEWGLYNPDAAGFEALFAKLEAIENGEEERVYPDRPRPRPLAMWAVQTEPPVDLLQPRRGRDEFRAIVSQFSIPHAVAAVSYASGAKVRRVRVRATLAPKPRNREEATVVILSRKLLKAARREAA